jgi:hypothetical protein
MLADVVEVKRDKTAAIASTSGLRDASVGDPRPRRFSRRQLLAGLCQFGVVGSAGAYTTQVEPFWTDYHDHPMPIRNLPAAFEGFRIAQLTDLHAGEDVPTSYLKHVIEKVVAARPDLVVITGDLVTHAVDYVNPICDLLGMITGAGIQAVATFGNHDYKHGDDGYSPIPLSEMLQQRLAKNRIPVLRNQSMAVTRSDKRLWLVGMEDLWCGQFSPAVAFAGMPTGEPIIALSHNPDTADELDGYGAHWILSGHTHGGQVRLPGVGALLVNIQNRQYQQGEFSLPRSKLYVSRGVGYLRRIRLMCRPEVPTFVLQSGTV